MGKREREAIDRATVKLEELLEIIEMAPEAESLTQETREKTAAARQTD